MARGTLNIVELKEKVLGYFSKYTYIDIKTNERHEEDVKITFKDDEDLLDSTSIVEIEFTIDQFPEWKFALWAYGYDNNHIDYFSIFTQHEFNIDKFNPTRSVFCGYYTIKDGGEFSFDEGFQFHRILEMLKVQPYIAWKMDADETKLVNFDVKKCEKEYLVAKKYKSSKSKKHKKKLTKIYNGIQVELKENTDLLKKFGCPYILLHYHEVFGDGFKPWDESLHWSLYFRSIDARKYLQKSFPPIQTNSLLGYEGNWSMICGGNHHGTVLHARKSMNDYIYFVCVNDKKFEELKDKSYWLYAKKETFDGVNVSIDYGEKYKEFTPYKE